MDKAKVKLDKAKVKLDKAIRIAFKQYHKETKTSPARNRQVIVIDLEREVEVIVLDDETSERGTIC